jgi:glycerophosphoryl diester phosphodiesterase
MTADLAEFDILLTKDNQLVVFHDRYLSKLTNISEL